MSLSHSPHEPGELECDPGKGQPSGRGGQGSYACALSRQSGLGATGMCVCMLLVGCHTKWFISISCNTSFGDSEHREMCANPVRITHGYFLVMTGVPVSQAFSCSLAEVRS